jgi:hypothetical protein
MSGSRLRPGVANIARWPARAPSPNAESANFLILTSGCARPAGLSAGMPSGAIKQRPVMSPFGWGRTGSATSPCRGTASVRASPEAVPRLAYCLHRETATLMAQRRPDDERVDMTYLSTIVSIAALLAVAIALLVQQHQARTAQMVDVRERHFELIKLMLEHPELDYNATDRPATDDRKTAIGMSLWVAHWNTLWHIGKLDEKALRFNLADLFADPEARRWWQQVNGAWSSKGSRRERRFLQIVGEEREAASVKPPAQRSAQRPRGAMAQSTTQIHSEPS